MSKILKILKILNQYFLRYRIIITSDIIEVKLTPKNNSENEINWIVKNDKQDKIKLYFRLKEILDKKRKA